MNNLFLNLFDYGIMVVHESPISFNNFWTDYHASGSYPTFIFFNILPFITLTWRSYKLLRRKWH